MRLLLDEGVPKGLRRSLTKHQVVTVAEMGWAGCRNGWLLARAASQFDALISVDKNLPRQQNLATLPVPVFVLDGPTNRLSDLLPLVPALERALQANTPGAVVVIGPDTRIRGE